MLTIDQFTQRTNELGEACRRKVGDFGHYFNAEIALLDIGSSDGRVEYIGDACYYFCFVYVLLSNVSTFLNK